MTASQNKRHISSRNQSQVERLNGKDNGAHKERGLYSCWIFFWNSDQTASSSSVVTSLLLLSSVRYESTSRGTLLHDAFVRLSALYCRLYCRHSETFHFTMILLFCGQPTPPCTLLYIALSSWLYCTSATVIALALSHDAADARILSTSLHACFCQQWGFSCSSAIVQYTKKSRTNMRLSMTRHRRLFLVQTSHIPQNR